MEMDPQCSMDSDEQDNLDSRAEFRKPSNEASNRKYRRRHTDGGLSSSSSDGHSLSPTPLRKDISNYDKNRKDDIHSHSSHRSESYKHSERKSPMSYHRHEDRSRREKHFEDYGRGYSKSSSRSRRDTRDDLDHSRGDKEHRNRDYSRSKFDSLGHKREDRDSYDRSVSGRRHSNVEERGGRVREKEGYRDDRAEKYGRSDHRKASRDHRTDHSPSHIEEESRTQQKDHSQIGVSGNNLKEASRKDGHEPGAGKCQNEKTRSDEHSDDVISVRPKKSKFSPLESTGPVKDGTSEQLYVTDSDIDAAKIAAMKAAELVNKNLVGTGYMSTDQKKKLLWGNKKSSTTTTEESAKRWEPAMFGDRERQEKFNKLMGVKGGDTTIDLKSENPDVEKQREQLQMELERQYTAGLRRKDGRTVGLGL
ncbi:hypothetical protein M569_08699 [Genlisea aurea]|uniref:Small acidic protein-like domain-containing protein n=1 Tax=Genlisea aurea TaxID=192259 RepID=S8DSF7_9LAMI|nr:hypothetical protein M569_08699 [Genlisea aurea]